MNCPFCGREMENGYLSSAGRGAKWTPKARSWTSICTQDGELPLEQWSFTGKNSTKALLCRACRKVILDIPFEEE